MISAEDAQMPSYQFSELACGREIAHGVGPDCRCWALCMLGSILQTYRQYSREQYVLHKLWATGTCAPSAELSRQEKTRFETSPEPLLTFRARST